MLDYAVIGKKNGRGWVQLDATISFLQVVSGILRDVTDFMC
jgi:hypothetical protein